MTPYDALSALLLLLSPFTILGIYDRRQAILKKLNQWTKPVKPKEPEQGGKP